jgi:hypothetical protein
MPDTDENPIEGIADVILDVGRALVRPVVTLLFAGAFVYLTVIAAVPIDAFVTVTTAVLSFWFAQRGNPH